MLKKNAENLQVIENPMALWPGHIREEYLNRSEVERAKMQIVPSSKSNIVESAPMMPNNHYSKVLKVVFACLLIVLGVLALAVCMPKRSGGT
jgi:hypothetical protein